VYDGPVHDPAAQALDEYLATLVKLSDLSRLVRHVPFEPGAESAPWTPDERQAVIDYVTTWRKLLHARKALEDHHKDWPRVCPSLAPTASRPDAEPTPAVRAGSTEEWFAAGDAAVRRARERYGVKRQG
jgi:hypothetical protein